MAIIAAVAILGVGLSSILQSNSTESQSKILSSVETPAATIIFTQRETLVYATRLAQWSNGGTPRRNVQIARNILAQRLAVIDTSGRSMGSRAQSSYWDALKSSDALVALAPAGILPENLHPDMNKKISPIIDQILAESRELAVSYQRTIDQDLLERAQATADRDRLNLILFYIFIAFGSLFMFFNVRTNFRNYRVARIALDVEQKRLDDTLDELRQTQSTVLELQDLDQAKNAFISTVNHELRTPLTSIIGYIEVIRDEKLDGDNPILLQYLDVLDRNAQILLNLVESMLSISRIDAQEGRLPDTKVCLNDIIDNAIFVMRPALDRTAITVTFNADEERCVQGDQGQLNQVFINLLANAIKFSPEKSNIEIALDSSVDHTGLAFARVSITDHGIGIPQEDISHLFTRFFRAKNADSGQYPGTGLGLAIVQQVVNRHLGKVHLQSEVGKGTTFYIEIPLFLSPEEKMIAERRSDVLARAIASLEAATPETIKEVTHEIGGAIGFYGFEEQGRELLKYSRFFDPSTSLMQFSADKARLLQLLKESSINNV
jgi:signal transduction histidine kinase